MSFEGGLHRVLWYYFETVVEKKKENTSCSNGCDPWSPPSIQLLSALCGVTLRSRLAFDELALWTEETKTKLL